MAVDGPPGRTTITEAEISTLWTDLELAQSSIAKQLPGAGTKGGLQRAQPGAGTVPGDFPAAPDWLSQRPLMTPDFAAMDRPAAEPPVPGSSLPRDIQELAIVDDLLSLLTGIEGKYIMVRPPTVPVSLGRASTVDRFVLDPSLDPSLAALAGRVLPVCAAYSAVACFIDGRAGFAHGAVRQALCGAIREMVKQYLVMVAQLETQFQRGNLSIQKMLLYIQPCIRTMELLAEIASDIHAGELIGGAVLSYLHEKTISSIGDVKAQELTLHLAQSAAAPYFATLEQWIYKGVVDDPLGEFMVVENKAITKEQVNENVNDKYWEVRYTVLPERTPSFLSRLADKILRTGKYLNVMREAGLSPHCPRATDLVYLPRERSYIDPIEAAFGYASQSLLDMLNTNLRLRDRLASLKSYFCMGCGDFFSHFLESAEHELNKYVKDIVPSRLEALVEMALRVSTASNDPFKDNLKVGLVPHNLVNELLSILKTTQQRGGKKMALDSELSGSTVLGIDAFTFEYDVHWPVSLIISRKSIRRYQLIFRQLLRCRHVERVLCKTWLSDQYCKQMHFPAGSWRLRAFALRQRMLNFVQSLQYYMMYEVVEPNWHTMVIQFPCRHALLQAYFTPYRIWLQSSSPFRFACFAGVLENEPKCLRTSWSIRTSQRLTAAGYWGALQANELAGASTIDDVLKAHDKFMDTCLKECLLTNVEFLRTISKLLAICGLFSNAMERLASELVSRAYQRNPDSYEYFAKHEKMVNDHDSKFSTLVDRLLDQLRGFESNATEAHMSNMCARLDFNSFYASKVSAGSVEPHSTRSTLLYESTFRAETPENLEPQPGVPST